MNQTHHVKVLDAATDGKAYSEIVSDPDVEVVANETLLPKTGEPLIVLKYAKKNDESPELKAPILGF